MNYGYFDHESKEYVITNPKTPVKWINYLGTRDFGGIIDQTGGALLCKGDPALNRISKYIPQLPDSSFKGTTMYLRIKDKQGKYQVISPFYTPCLTELDSFECHVGLQYQTIQSKYQNLEFKAEIFIPHGGNSELRIVTIKNSSKKAVKIDCIPVVEYTHFDALKQFTNADWVPQTMQSWMQTEETNDGTRSILRQAAFMKVGVEENYMTSSWPIDSFETDREVFLGSYGTWAKPLSLQQTYLANTEANRGNNIAALLLNLGKLNAGEERSFVVQLGQHSYETEGTLPKIYSWQEAQKELYVIQEFWDDYLKHFQVDTPDESFNHMFNVHNQRQCFITYQWSRYLSLYQLGLGARGMGTRDSAQDILGILHVKPDLAKERIKELFSIQLANGSAMHQFNPLTMEANAGDSREEADRPNYYGDDHLWIVLALCWYLKETGDFDFLQEKVPYYKDPKSEKDVVIASIEDHLIRALKFTCTNTGANGLPLLGFADWNDTVNLETGAESLFNAHLFGFCLKEVIELYEFLNDDFQVIKYSKMYDAMRSTVRDRAWDGNWFIRYITKDNEDIGSSENEYGQIFLNAQTWAVLSGFADGKQAQRAMESVSEKLYTKSGLVLSWPGYEGYDEALGGVTTYPPGAKENGGVFCHTNPWAVIAETILGNNDLAFHYFNNINPATKNYSADKYEIEPYVYAQNILSDVHPQAGLGRNSWLSGVASWSFVAASRYILGIQPGYSGLFIDPKLPQAWETVKLIRTYRGKDYQISITKDRTTGEYSIEVNGEKVEPKTIVSLELQKTM
jgi:cellobiose phosphorylase